MTEQPTHLLGAVRVELLQQEVEVWGVGFAGVAVVVGLWMMVLRVQLHAGAVHARAVTCWQHAQGVGLQLLAACARAAMAVAVPCAGKHLIRALSHRWQCPRPAGPEGPASCLSAAAHAGGDVSAAPGPAVYAAQPSTGSGGLQQAIAADLAGDLSADGCWRTSEVQVDTQLWQAPSGCRSWCLRANP